MFRIVFALVLALFQLPCCCTEAPEAPNRVLVFLDRSASTHLDPADRAVFADTVRTATQRLLNAPGSQVSLFLVHAKTTAEAERKNFDFPAVPGLDSQFPDEVTRARGTAQRKVLALLDSAETTFHRFIETSSGPARLARGTDLLGSLQVISEEVDTTMKARWHVYYLSDMFECMPGPGRRDFEVRPPADVAQARAWAEADARWAKANLSVDPERLRHVEVHVLRGRLGQRDHAEEVKAYWTHLFKALNIAAVRY